MPRQAEQYHIHIWKNKEWNYIFLDEAFKYDDWLQWLCWTAMQFHTEDEYEEAKQNYIDSWDLLYLRKEAVQAERTTNSYEEWLEEVIENDECLVYDDSYRCSYRIDEALEIIDEHEYEETWIHATSEFSDCVWWWRCFDKKMLDKNYRERIEEENFEKFKELYEKYEKPNDDKYTLEEAKKRFKELYNIWIFDSDLAKSMWNLLHNWNVEFAEKFLENRKNKFDSHLSFNE